MNPLKADPHSSNIADKILQILGILLLTISCSIVFLALLGNVLSSLICDVNLYQVDFAASLSTQEVSAIKFLQFMSQIGIYFMPPVLFAILYKQPVVQFYNGHKPLTIKLLIWIILFLVAAVPASDFLVRLFDNFPGLDEAVPWFHKLLPWFDSFIPEIESLRESQDQNLGLTNQMIGDLSFGGLVVSYLILAIMPGIVEELYFRGLLQGTILRITGKPVRAIVISSIFFALFHPLLGFFGYFAMSLLLGFLYHYTRNIKVNMLFHFLNNGLALTLELLHRAEVISFGMDESLPIIWGISGLIAVAVLFYFFRKDQLKPKMIRSQDQTTSVAWVKVYSGTDPIKTQYVCNQLNDEGYNAVVLNKQSSSHLIDEIEVHVPFHQLDSAMAFVKRLDL